MTVRFTIRDYASLSPEDQAAFTASLEQHEAAHLSYDWRFWARDDQLPPDDPDWLYWMLLAGRGAGKTRAGAEWVRDMVEAHWETPIQIALVGPTAADVRDVMVDGPSGLLSVCPPDKMPKYQPTRRRVIWPNGSKAFLYSAEQPDRLRGPQHHFAWCFIAGTMVATPDGEVPIETLKPGDLVLTRKGPRRVLANSWRLAPVGQVAFSHGRDLVGTADHPIYSGGNWRRLDRLHEGASACVIAASNGVGLAGISTALAVAPTTSAPTSGTAFAGAFASIARCGARLTATFRRAWMSITSMATAKTTTSPIWPLSITPATAAIIGHWKSRAAIGAPSSPVPWLVTTAARLSCASVGGARSVSPASHAARSTAASRHATASIAATGSPAGPETIAASVVSTWRPVGERFVFCLKVEGEPEYFANGVLVHNCDELAAWQYGQDTWDMLQFGLRLGDHPRAVITTTPRPIKLVRDLVNDPSCRISSASTYDNLANLAPVFLDRIVRRYEGTRLGMQELYAKLLTDNPDALWTLSQLEGLRVPRPPQDLDRIVVAVDPPTTSGENADECGIVVAGCRGKDWRTREAFVLADASSQGEKPNKWAWRVITTAKLYGADAIIVETNQGGEMVMETISALDRSIPIKGVHASKGKYTRAEPVAAFYEQGRVHHVGHLSKLEDQLCEMTIDFDKVRAGFSPDRMDALVYAITDLLNPPGRAGSRSQ